MGSTTLSRTHGVTAVIPEYVAYVATLVRDAHVTIACIDDSTGPYCASLWEEALDGKLAT